MHKTNKHQKMSSKKEEQRTARNLSIDAQKSQPRTLKAKGLLVFQKMINIGRDPSRIHPRIVIKIFSKKLMPQPSWIKTASG
uniref:Uncharacterized protein n=1 Tax=Panagrolaimus sp. JU765 TaxID=591449 RepID=A0AC34QPF8_9BILA